ncbi:hypothetical protein [Tepidibacillus marianensis]|uniref:hypothetical protein n=1 Tax=Tepidibacillus marianensis TaxID=3131995 RepID=UPI0030CFD535
MIKIAGITNKKDHYAKYELITLSINENERANFQSSFHFTRLPLTNESDVVREIESSVIDIIAVDTKITIELNHQSKHKVIRVNPDECYLALGFVKQLEQIQRERELWRVQMQDQLKRAIRGIDGPCEQLYTAEMLDAFVMALYVIKNLDILKK